ncbi:MAG: hypothetical protein WCC04_03430 [Terriglobales bacterium]
MTHAKLVGMAVAWLRRYRCGVVLSEQACASGEMPDAIGWKKKCHSVLVECKASRADFLADSAKPWRERPETGVGAERYYLASRELIEVEELPAGWGLLEVSGHEIATVRRSAKDLRSSLGFQYEMNLLLASLRRVEVRIEPQSITDFLKWKNRMVEYNGGALPGGMVAAASEENLFLEAVNGHRIEGIEGKNETGLVGPVSEASR